jgi:signal transduction histidine kinase
LRVAGLSLAAGAAALSVAGVVIAAALPGYFATFVAGHLLINASIGVAYATLGSVIVWARPRNPIGWLLIAAAWLGGGLAAFGEPYGVLAVRGHSAPAAAWMGWLGGWSWSVAFLLGPTVILSLWPSGRATGRLRWLVIASAVAIGVVAVGYALSPDAMTEPVRQLGHPLKWRYGDVIAFAGFPLLVVCLFGSLGAAVARLWRSVSPEREQLGWYLAVTVAVFVCSVTLSSQVNTVIQPLLILTLGFALLWHGLFDLRLVLRRTLVYGVLTGCVAVAYAVVTAVLSARMPHGPLSALVAAAVVAVGLIPLRDLLQRGADRVVYGGRRDPVRAVAQVGAGMTRSGEALLPAVAAAVAEALRSPQVVITDTAGRMLARHGDPAVGAAPHMEALDHQGAPQGTLSVVARTAGEPLDRADRRLLEALVPQVALAVRATALTAQLQRSRNQVLAAAQQERERLRRELHDGLGPALGGLALGLEAAESLLDDHTGDHTTGHGVGPGIGRGVDHAAARQILARTRAEARTAVIEIRRIIDDLRPDILDELGLIDALRRHAQLVTAGGQLSVHIDAANHEAAPAVDSRTELAAYRIAMEAITNTIRHSGARTCTVRLSITDTLDLDISDDGCGIPDHPRDGVGLTSIRQRVTACGGTATITGTTNGTRLHIRLPSQPPPHHMEPASLKPLERAP